MKTFSFADYYKDVRKRNGLTQKQLADIVGTTQQAVSIVEKSNKEFGAGKLVLILKKFPKEGALFVKMIKESRDAERSA